MRYPTSSSLAPTEKSTVSLTGVPSQATYPFPRAAANFSSLSLTVSVFHYHGPGCGSVCL